MEQKKKSKVLPIILIVLALLVVAAVAIVLFVFVIKPANQYKEAAALRDSGNYVQAAATFAAMEDYKDAPAQVLVCNYKEALRLETEGRTAAAAMAYGALGDYEDAKARSFALWERIVPRDSFAIDPEYMIGIKEDGTLTAFTRQDVEDGTYESVKIDAADEVTDIVDIAIGTFSFYALTSDGAVLEYAYGKWTPLEGWTDIVSIEADSSLMGTDPIVGLRSDGTILYDHSVAYPPEDGQDNVGGWRNIISVKCSDYITVGLRANGTVIATGSLLEEDQAEIDSWTDIVAIEAGTFHVLGLKADGTVEFAGDETRAYSRVSDWTNVIALSGSSDCTMGLTADGTVLHTGTSYHENCVEWTDIVAISDKSDCYGLKHDGTMVLLTDMQWHQIVGTWTNIRQPAFYAYYELDDQIQVDAEAEKGTFTPKEDEPFTNKYGTPTTTCAHTNCAAYIASSGDTNCCPWHSNRCGNCHCYIDEDAMYCMDCIRSALD